MTGPQDVANKFYSSFAKRDADGMAACYSPHIWFSDPTFPNLHGPAAIAMWSMLCMRAKDLHVTHNVISAVNDQVKVVWEARYTFSATGRTVHNKIVAALTIENGKITRHVDRFDFWRWAEQALGPIGLLLGWTPFLRKKVRAQAAQALNAYMQVTFSAKDV